MMIEKQRCACGAEIEGLDNPGCSDCIRETLLELHAKRPEVVMPRNWWRKFEPEWSCGAYYLYGRSDLTGTTKRSFQMELSKLEIITACQLGVTIEYVDHDVDHLEVDIARAFGNVMLIAAGDHVFLKESESTESMARHIAERIARWRRA